MTGNIKYDAAISNMKEVNALLNKNVDDQRNVTDDDAAVMCMCNCLTRAIQAKNIAKRTLEDLK